MNRHHWFFDFDGTLCDTEPDIRATWLTALHELGLDCPHFNDVYRTGPTLDAISMELFPGASAERLAAIRNTFKRVYDASGFPQTHPYPGVEAWLKSLRENGASLYIMTNKRQVPTRILLDTLGWSSIFKGVYCSDSDPANRRTKAVLLHDALIAEGADASDSVMIGDTVGDIAAARANSGVFALAVDWGYGARKEFPDADRVICLSDLDGGCFV